MRMHPTALGQVHLREGRLTDAVDVSRRALEIDPAIARRDTSMPRRSSGWETSTRATPRCRCFSDSRPRTARHGRAHSSSDVCDARRRSRARLVITPLPSTLLQRALVLDPRAAASHLDLGLALLDGGQVAAAIERLNTAAALKAPLDVHRHLAKAYAALGQKDESAKEQATYERLRQRVDQQDGQGAVRRVVLIALCLAAMARVRQVSAEQTPRPLLTRRRSSRTSPRTWA